MVLRLVSSRVLVLALLASALPESALAQDAQELVRKADKRHKLQVERRKGKMLLQSEQGDQRTLVFDELRLRDEAAGDKLKLKFVGPADIRGTALLNVKAKGSGSDEQWLYLPSFRKTRRVGGAELGERFVSSDLFFEDLKQRDVDDFKYKLLRSESLKGVDCHVIEGVPASDAVAKESPYGKTQLWLRKDNLTVQRLRVFDHELKPMKEFEFANFKNVKGEAWSADLLTVVDVRRKHRTVISIDERTTPPSAPPDAFSQHNLGSE
jgi:Outer membrane lipoprotein-sorting protein